MTRRWGRGVRHLRQLLLLPLEQLIQSSTTTCVTSL